MASSIEGLLGDLGTTGRGIRLFGNVVGDATKASIGLAGTLLSGSQKLSDYSNAITNNTKLLGKLDKAVNGLVQFAEQSLGEYQALTGIGATFGKEMTQIKIAAAELGLSVEDMTKLLVDNATSLRAFGGTTEMSVQKFRQFASGILDSGLGTNLRRLGYTAAEINDTLITYQEIAEQDGNMNRRSEAQRAASAAAFATELDRMAKLTGKQRQQLADEMKEARRRGDIQAYLMDKDAEAQAAFTAKYTEISNTMGKEAADAFADLAIRGTATTETTRNALVAMGPAADQLANAANQFNAGNISGFNDAITQAQGATLDYLRTDEARQAAMLGGMSNISSAFGSLYEGTYDLGNAVEGMDTDGDSAQRLADLNNQISTEQARQLEMSNGLLDRTIQMQEAVRDMTIMATQEAMPRLEEMAMRGIQKFMDVLPSAATMAQEIGQAVGGLLDEGSRGIFGDLAGQLDPSQTGASTDNVAEANAQSVGAAVDGVAPPIVEAVNAEAQRAAQEAEAMAQRQEQAQAALDDANSALTDAVSQREAAAAAAQEATDRVAAMTEAGFQAQDPQLRAAQEEANRAAAEAERAASIAEATQRTVSSLSHTARTGTPRGFAEGGRINANEIGMVGEAGPEFIAGPANVMSANTSMGVMQTLMKSIKTLDSKVQERPSNAGFELSNSINSDLMNGMNGKFDSMISLLSQLINVEAGAAQTANRTMRATKGLQGNMLKGLG